MRTVGSLLAALLLSGPARAQRGGIDVKGYWFMISLPDSGSTIHGGAVVRFARRVPEDSVLTLDLVGMNVDGVGVAYIDQDRAFDIRDFRYDGRVLRIPLPAGPPALQAVISYHGSPQDGLIIGPNGRGRRVAFADNWPERARFWLPTVDHPSDKAIARFSIKVPAEWRVVANGRLTPAGDGSEWDESHPIPMGAVPAAPSDVGDRRAGPSGRAP